MIAEDIRDILFQLLDRTKRRQVNWVDSKQYGLEATAPEDYLVVLPNSSINLWRSTASDEPDVIYGNVLNSEGQAVVRFDSKDNEADSQLLEELLDWAKRSALKADQTLEEIKRALAGEKPVGIPNAKKNDMPF